MNLKRYLISALLLTQTPLYAITPVQGWYAGIFLGVSGTETSSFTFEPPLNFTGTNFLISAQSGTLSRSVLGDVGGELGYRFCDNYRIEGEVLYNNNPFRQLTLYNVTVQNITFAPGIGSTPSVIYENFSDSAEAHIQGDVNTGAFMVNGYYDFFIPSNDGYSRVVPFVGLGIGYSYVQNALQLYRATTTDPALDPWKNREIFDIVQTRTTYAGQAIAGIHYYMDDFAWLSLDVRYFATGSSSPESSFTITTPTAVYSQKTAINIFGNNMKLLTANISFNGAFDAG